MSKPAAIAAASATTTLPPLADCPYKDSTGTPPFQVIVKSTVTVNLQSGLRPTTNKIPQRNQASDRSSLNKRNIEHSGRQRGGGSASNKRGHSPTQTITIRQNIPLNGNGEKVALLPNNRQM
jgi:hypothetical protein